MKILVIEDEIKLAEYLKKGLGEAGHNVDIVHNGVDGLHLALEGGYDLLILDGMLPGIDGFTQDEADPRPDAHRPGQCRRPGARLANRC